MIIRWQWATGGLTYSYVYNVNTRDDAVAALVRDLREYEALESVDEIVVVSTEETS